MSTARSYEPISVSDYLAGELESEIRHEYVAGYVYAMVGGTNAHNRIGRNCLVHLANQLAGHPCEPFASDTKVRISQGNDFWFYYPDVSVTRRPNSQSDLFQDHPVVVIEVLSGSTRRNDELEKRNDYFTLPSLKHYILLEQHSIGAIHYQPADSMHSTNPDDWKRMIYTDFDDILPLNEIQCQLPLKTVYQDIEFPSR